MMQSMTGYAVTTVTLNASDGSQTHVTISLKSLNSRFFEISCRIPVLFAHIETACIKIIKEKLQRGNAFLSITTDNQNIFQGLVEPSLPIAKSYINAINRIQKECNLPGTITIADMLRLSNTIFTIEQKGCDTSIEQAIMQSVTRITDDLVASRLQEGAALQQDMQQRCENIHRDMQAITQHVHTWMEKKQQEISKKIAELTQAQETPEFISMRKNTLCLELDKADVHEEIVRFDMHLSNLQTLCTSNEQEMGKRVNFILQELGREINTLASKCPDPQVGTLAINVKVELEKIREQSQNIL